MDQLDKKLTKKLFSFLPLTDLVKCMQLNRKYYDFINDEFSLDNLIINHKKLPLNQRWFEDYELMDYDNQIRTNDYSYIQFDNRIFKNLQKLFIVSTDYSNPTKFNLTFLFNQINRLHNLRSLQFVGIKMEVSNRVELNLNNLETLSIERIENGHITLNTPNLTNLQLKFKSSSAQIKEPILFTYPESIRRLETLELKSSVTKLKNLESLHVSEEIELENLVDIEDYEENLFERLPKLKEFLFFETIDTFEYLVEQRKKFNRSDLKIYYLGLDTSSLRELGEIQDIQENLSPYFVLDKNSIKYFAANHSRLIARQPFATRLIYNDLDDIIEHLPGKLFNHFVNLKSIQATKQINDVSKFSDFLSTIKHLKLLELKYTLLNQNFFDRLPKIVPVLNDLVIYSQEDLNYDFLIEFDNLNGIFFSENIDLDTVYNVFIKFKDLEFSFYLDDTQIKIDANSSKFQFRIGQKEPVEFQSLADLFKQLVHTNFDEDGDIVSDYSLQDDLEDEEEFNGDDDGDEDIEDMEVVF